ncbi:MAG: hypothetical protein ACTHK7_17860 [Aureliella sp.]
MTNRPVSFDLWLETEVGDPDHPANRCSQNFCNVSVKLEDGRRYALNVWTFDFLPLARYPWPYEPNENAQRAEYLLAPDLFVESLDRDVIHRTIAELLATDQMKNEWLVDECD